MSDTIGRRKFLEQTATGASGIALSSAVALAENNASPKIKVGVITHAGGAHLGAYFDGLAKCEYVESVVVADPDSKAGAAAKEKLGGKLNQVYLDRRELLATEKPEMALVSVEAKRGPAAIDDCLEAGCHVLAEKPACVRVADFEPLVAKAAEKNLHLMLALANRLNPEVVEAKRLVSTGQIGKIYGVELQLVADQTRLKSKAYQQTWFAYKSRAGGGHLSWLGIHWLDLAMFITGSKIEQVAGFAGNVGGQPIGVEDSAAMAIHFDNGTFGTLTSGYYLDKGYHSLLKIWGSEGWLRIEFDKPRAVTWYRTGHSKSAAGEVYQATGEYVAYTEMVKAAVQASMGLQDAPLSGSDALTVLKAVFGLYEAAETGKTISI